MIEFEAGIIFIIASYVGVALVLSLLIGWVWLNSNKQKARLVDLEKRGIHRRSKKNNPDKTEQTL